MASSYLIDEIRNQGALNIELMKRNKVLERQYIKMLGNYNDAKKWGDAREAKMLEQDQQIKDLISEKGLNVMSKQIKDLEGDKLVKSLVLEELQKKLSQSILEKLEQEKRNNIAAHKLTKVADHLEQIRRISSE